MDNKISKVIRYGSSLEKSRPQRIDSDRPNGIKNVIPLKFEFISEIGERQLKRDNLLTEIHIDMKLGRGNTERHFYENNGNGKRYFYANSTRTYPEFKSLPVFKPITLCTNEGQSAFSILDMIHSAMMERINPSTRIINKYYSEHNGDHLQSMYAGFEFFYEEPCNCFNKYDYYSSIKSSHGCPISLIPWNTKLKSGYEGFNEFKFFYSHRFTIKPFYNSKEVVYELFEFRNDSPVKPNYFILLDVYNGKASILPGCLIGSCSRNTKSENIYALMVLLWKFMNIDDIMIDVRGDKKSTANDSYKLLDIVLNSLGINYDDIQTIVLKELFEKEKKAERKRKLEEYIRSKWNFAPKYQPVKPIITPVIKGKAGPEYKEHYEFYDYPDEVLFADEIDDPEEEIDREEESKENEYSLMDKILIGRVGNSTKNKILELEGMDYEGDDIEPYVRIFESQKEDGLY